MKTVKAIVYAATLSCAALSLGACAKAQSRGSVRCRDLRFPGSRSPPAFRLSKPTPSIVAANVPASLFHRVLRLSPGMSSATVGAHRSIARPRKNPLGGMMIGMHIPAPTPSPGGAPNKNGLTRPLPARRLGAIQFSFLTPTASSTEIGPLLTAAVDAITAFS